MTGFFSRNIPTLAAAVVLGASGTHAGASSIRSTVCLENTTAHPVTMRVAEVESYDYERDRPDHAMQRNVLASGAVGCWPLDTNSHATFPAFTLAFEGYPAWDRFVLMQGAGDGRDVRWAVRRKVQTMVRGDPRHPGHPSSEFELGYACNRDGACSLFRITDETLAAPERVLNPPDMAFDQPLTFPAGRMRLERLDALRVPARDGSTQAYQLMLHASANLTIHACHDPACTRGDLVWESGVMHPYNQAFANFGVDGRIAVHAHPTEPGDAALWRSERNPSLDWMRRDETALTFGTDGVLRIQRVADGAALWRSDARS